MPKLDKGLMIGELKEHLQKNRIVVLTGYLGLDSNEMTELRQSLERSGAELLVVKNRLARLAMQEEPWTQLAQFVTGPTAVVMTSGDPIAVAKTLDAFTRGHKHLQVKAGMIGPQVVSGAEVTSLARLPGKEVLLARLFGTLVSPVARFLNVISSPVAAFARCLDAVREKKDSK